MKRFASILITLTDNGHVTAAINADIPIADILLGFALLQQKIIENKTQNKKKENKVTTDFTSVEERLRRD